MAKVRGGGGGPGVMGKGKVERVGLKGRCRGWS